MIHRLLLLLCFLPFVSLRASTPMVWRGLMLDSGRQYQTVECIEALLDSMATRGMNTFHWHLTENDGWRMALRCAPRLTSVGAYVADGPEQQGFYTRREMKHIVRYARRRGITVVPEIDLPGHSAALISAYPEYLPASHRGNKRAFGKLLEIPSTGNLPQCHCRYYEKMIKTFL